MTTDSKFGGDELINVIIYQQQLPHQKGVSFRYFLSGFLAGWFLSVPHGKFLRIPPPIFAAIISSTRGECRLMKFACYSCHW